MRVAFALSPDIKNIYIAVNSFETDSILRYDAKTGDFLNAFVPTGRGGLDGPTSIVFVKDIPEPNYAMVVGVACPKGLDPHDCDRTNSFCLYCWFSQTP